LQLASELRRAAESFAEGLPFADLARAAALLKARYREGSPTAAATLAPAFRVAAYMVTRFPATHAAAAAVLAEAPWKPSSILDLAAGAGAASLAARLRWPALTRLTAIESDPAFIDAGRKLLPDAAWIEQDLRVSPDLPAADVVIASYGLSELGEPHALRVARAAWDACRLGAVFIEPGTTRGFQLIRALRDLGPYLVAPCPHCGPCPVVPPDWCHFSRRVERSSLHRRLDRGTLGYEDEKFSYVILSRNPVEPRPGARVVRHPRHHPGFIELRLCAGGALLDITVTRRDKDRFRVARKARWGALLPLDLQVVDDLESP
jgi:ribosomal protein RSM22 (predicted rRNA methylase)